MRCRWSLLALTLAVLALALGQPAAAQPADPIDGPVVIPRPEIPGGGDGDRAIVIDTDRGTIDGDGAAFNGTAFTVRREAGVTIFEFAGDFVVPDGAVLRGNGLNAASLRASNNVLIGANVTIDVAGVFAAAGAGGGAGGGLSSGGTGGAAQSAHGVFQGGQGGFGEVVDCFLTICGVTRATQNGVRGNGPFTIEDNGDTLFANKGDKFATDAGGAGVAGEGGRAGAAGVGAGGAGGAGGTGGAGGVALEPTFIFFPDPDSGSRIQTDISDFINQKFLSDLAALQQFTAETVLGPGTAGDANNALRLSGGNAFPTAFGWMHGQDGSVGEDGAGGAGGANDGFGEALTGGGGGGAGGAGGGGGGANSGLPGFSGGGGAGGTATNTAFGVMTGGTGGAGGDGGQGGLGTPGDIGGFGGSGGGGGGALEIVAKGRLVIDPSSKLTADGGDGALGGAGGAGGARTPGGAANSVRNPGTAGSVDAFGRSSNPGNPGGLGGPGGDGGAGGAGGDGGAGGGGAGGTVKLVGSVFDGNGADVSARAGAGGGGDAADGGEGRLVFGLNSGATAEQIAANRTLGAGQVKVFDGPRGVNPFIRGGVETPFLPDLLDGAALFGLLDGVDTRDAFFTPFLDDLQGDPLAALLRLPSGPGPLYAHSFFGFDWVFLLNLGYSPLEHPLLGIDPAQTDSAFLTPLTLGGWRRDLAFGGDGDVILRELDAFAVYATLTPSDGTLFNLSLNGAQSSTELKLGQPVFFGAASVPLPASGWLLLGGLAAIGLLRRRSRDAMAPYFDFQG